MQKRNEWIMTHRQSGGTLPSECHKKMCPELSFSPKGRNFCSFCVESGSVLHVINTPCRHRKGYVMFRYSLYRMLIEAFLYAGKGFSGIQEKGFKDTEQTKY